MKNILLILIIVCMIGLLVKGILGDERFAGKNIHETAARIIKTCQDKPSRPRCYDSELPKLMATFPMEEVFAVTKKIQSQDLKYPYCHTLGHELSTIETKKDPEKWTQVVTRCPSGMCSNGCIHGAFQERFRTEILQDSQIDEVLPELQTVCEPRGVWNPTGLERASCYHALGHLLMYITRADIVKSTSFCDVIADRKDNGDFRNVCYDGAFMQIFQPLDREDIILLAGRTVDRPGHEKFCQQFLGEKRTSCISEGWPLYLLDLREPQGLVNLCGKTPSQFRNRCVIGLLYVMVVQLRFDFPSIKEYCTGLPDDYRGRCFAMTASRLIETDYDNVDRAISWCKDNATDDPAGACLAQLVEEAGFVFQRGTDRFSAFCAKLPDDRQNACREKKN